MEKFVMLLPGCKVTVETLAEGSYRVLELTEDVNYEAVMKDDTKPGLYRAKMGIDGWEANRLNKGRITDEKTA